MKKLLLISLLILSLVLVGCKEEPVTGAVVVEQETQKCKDSDNGINTEIQGVVTVGDEDYADDCIAGLLIEYFCEGNQKVNQNLRCTNKCSSGKCI